MGKTRNMMISCQWSLLNDLAHGAADDVVADAANDDDRQGSDYYVIFIFKTYCIYVIFQFKDSLHIFVSVIKKHILFLKMTYWH